MLLIPAGKSSHLHKTPQNLTVWSHPGAQQRINLLSLFLISTLIDNHKDRLGTTLLKAAKTWSWRVNAPWQGFVSRWDLGGSSPLHLMGQGGCLSCQGGHQQVKWLLVLCWHSRVNETTQQPPPGLTRHPQLASGLGEIIPTAGQASPDSYMVLKIMWLKEEKRQGMREREREWMAQIKGWIPHFSAPGKFSPPATQFFPIAQRLSCF